MPGVLDEFDKRQSAAVENGEFKVVQFHDGVVDAQADKSREQVLGGGNEHAFFHQAGGVADAGHVAADGFDFKTIEIDALKNNSRSGRGGKNAHADAGAAVESYATAFYGRADCLLLSQAGSWYVPSIE